MLCQHCDWEKINEYDICERCGINVVYDDSIVICNACGSRNAEGIDSCWNCDLDPALHYWDCPYCNQKEEEGAACGCGLTEDHLKLFREGGWRQ